MTLDLLKRSESGAPLTSSQFDGNMTAIETEVNGKLSAPDAGGAAVGNYVNSSRTQALPYTLVASDRGKIIRLTTSGGTLTVPAVGVLGNGSQVILINGSAGSIAVDGPGATNATLAAGQVATLIEDNGIQSVTPPIALTVIS